jgi:hypothetical protein
MALPPPRYSSLQLHVQAPCYWCLYAAGERISQSEIFRAARRCAMRLALLWWAVAIVLAVVLFYWPTIYRGSYAVADWGRESGAYRAVQQGQVSRGDLYAPYMHGFSPVLRVLPRIETASAISALLVIYASAGIVGMVLVCQLLGATMDVSLLVGALFGGFGALVSRWEVGHVYVLGAYLLPLVLYAWMRRWRVIVALLLAIAILEDFHHGTVYIVLALIGLALVQSLMQLRRTPLVDLLIVAGMTCALAGFKIAPEVQRFWGYMAWEGLNPVPLVWLPSMLMYPDRLPSVAFGLWEWDMYLGWGGIILALGVVCSVVRFRVTLPWLVTSLCFALWALGVGAAVVPSLPVIRSQGVLARVLMAALVLLMPAAAVGLEWLLAPLRRIAPMLVHLGIAAIGALCIWDLWSYSLRWQYLLPEGFPILPHPPQTLCGAGLWTSVQWAIAHPVGCAVAVVMVVLTRLCL